MIDKNIFSNLNIESKNTLKDDTTYSVSNNYIPFASPNEMCNFIMNSNLECNSAIK